MRLALADVALDSDCKPLWNCTFVRPDKSATARQACARDLALHGGPFETGRHPHHPDVTDNTHREDSGVEGEDCR